MIKSIVMHQLDYNHIAACEEWYYKCHAPQIARRYGPWLARFESYRPVPLPADFDGEKLGYTNWLTTVGYWREIPKEGAMGEMAMSSPRADARNFSAFLPPQYEDDFKGAEYAPEEKACLRMLLLIQYPESQDREEADRYFTGVLAREICACDAVYRFFSVRAETEEIHLPGNWKPDTMKRMMQTGNPEDHRWDRVVQLWFETFDDVREFFRRAENFAVPPFAERESFPYLRPYEHCVSAFLLERPAYDWMRSEYNVYR